MRSGWRHLGKRWSSISSLGVKTRYLQRWFHTPVGQEILRQEMQLIDECRRGTHGEFMLQASTSGEQLLGMRSNRRCRISIWPNAQGVKYNETNDSYPLLCADMKALPLEDNSVDFLLLHHCVEYSSDPHAVLREAVRVLAPQGQLLIASFNPHSCFGLLRILAPFFRSLIPWRFHSLPRRQLADWLRVMSCQPVQYAQGFHMPPLQSSRYFRSVSFLNHWFNMLGLSGGGYYMVLATKQSLIGGTPVGYSKIKPLCSAVAMYDHQ